MSFHRFTEDEVDIWFKKGDADNDGSISAKEYGEWEEHMMDCGNAAAMRKVDIRSFFGYIHWSYNLNIFLLSLTVQSCRL